MCGLKNPERKRSLPGARLLTSPLGESTESRRAEFTPVRGEVCGSQSRADGLHFSKVVAQQALEKTHILLPASHQFGNRQVMDFQAKARAATRIWVLDWNETIPPSSG